jgi:hypothetical protein
LSLRIVFNDFGHQHFMCNANEHPADCFSVLCFAAGDGAFPSDCHYAYSRLDEYKKSTRVDWMIRDVSRYLPAISDARYVESLFEVKTVLAKNEADDGRPILFVRHPALPDCYSMLGGKIDNIYDVLEKLGAESFEPS